MANEEMNVFDHCIPHHCGVHPDYPHLIYFEVEAHYGSFILTSPAVRGTALISAQDWLNMAGSQEQADLEFAYASDEYLELFER